MAERLFSCCAGTEKKVQFWIGSEISQRQSSFRIEEIRANDAVEPCLRGVPVATDSMESTLTDPLSPTTGLTRGSHPEQSRRVELPLSVIGAADCAFITPNTVATQRHAERHTAGEKRHAAIQSVMGTSQNRMT